MPAGASAPLNVNRPTIRTGKAEVAQYTRAAAGVGVELGVEVGDIGVGVAASAGVAVGRGEGVEVGGTTAVGAGVAEPGAVGLTVGESVAVGWVALGVGVAPGAPGVGEPPGRATAADEVALGRSSSSPEREAMMIPPAKNAMPSIPTRAQSDAWKVADRQSSSTLRL